MDILVSTLTRSNSTVGYIIYFLVHCKQTPQGTAVYSLDDEGCVNNINNAFNQTVSHPLFQLISDAGYQGEITSVSTACHQIEVFTPVLRTTIGTFLEGGEEAIEKNIPEFTVRKFSHSHEYLSAVLTGELCFICCRLPARTGDMRRSAMDCCG